MKSSMAFALSYMMPEAALEVATPLYDRFQKR
jgi:hypothetical protein